MPVLRSRKLGLRAGSQGLIILLHEVFSESELGDSTMYFPRTPVRIVRVTQVAAAQVGNAGTYNIIGAGGQKAFAAAEDYAIVPTSPTLNTDQTKLLFPADIPIIFDSVTLPGTSIARLSVQVELMPEPEFHYWLRD